MSTKALKRKLLTLLLQFLSRFRILLLLQPI